MGLPPTAFTQEPAPANPAPANPAPANPAPQEPPPRAPAPANPAPEDATVPSGSPDHEGSVRRVPNAHRTMLGMSAKELAMSASEAPAPAPPAPSPPAAAPLPGRGATMLGQGGGLAQQGTPALASAGPAPAPSGRTMLGVPYAPPGPAPQGTASNRPPPRKEGPPMMGGPSPGIPPDTLPPGSAKALRPPSAPAEAPPTNHREPAGSSLDIEIPGLPRKRRKPGNGLAIALFVAALGLLAGAAVLYVRFRGVSQRDTLAAQARTRPEGGLLVTLTVPRAAPGTRVRYQGSELPLDPSGRVEFPVDARDSVGTIDLPVVIVAPNGATEERAMRITVPYHVTADFRRLGDDPPRVHLVFRVPQGASLAVAGQTIQLSGDTGIAELPAPRPIPVTQAEGVRRERFPIRVRLADGAVLESEYTLNIPRHPLRVEFPPATVVVNAPRVTVRGRAPGATRVLVGRQHATITAGAFSAELPLDADRVNVDVVAYGPSGAPAVSSLVIQRNVTADAWLHGNGAGVAALVGQAPPDGTRLRLVGTVLGEMLPAAEGRTFQLAVDDRQCPGGHCVVWVTPTDETVVHERDRVEVLGELRGSRTYTTREHERRTDRAMVAPFILPSRR